MSPSVDLTFPVSYTFCLKNNIKARLNFKKKSENENYSILNACGLAIVSNFYLYWFFRNLSYFERDPHMDSPEAIRIKSGKI
jgi:hypothetical protein